MSQITAILRRCANSLMTMLSPMRAVTFLWWEITSGTASLTVTKRTAIIWRKIKSIIILSGTEYLTRRPRFKKKFELQLRSTLDSLKLEKKSDYGKVKAIYDYICDNVKYDNTHGPNYSQKYTAYAALVNKAPSARGISTLLYRMCKAADIPVRIVAGTGAKTKIILEHRQALGEVYYNVDATWDAGDLNTLTS